MLILPHSTALDLEGHAYTTYAVAILCIIIFYFQMTNNALLISSTESYCSSIYTSSLNDESIDVMKADIGNCETILGIYLYELEYMIPDFLKEIKGNKYFIFNAQLDEVMNLMQGHYEHFQKNAPESLNAKLMYYPDFPNPIKMITSSMAHADIFHIAGNLLFFLAFAPALELLIGNVLKYLGVMLLITFSTSISYSLVTLFSSSDAIPSLGLSGVVMGMIGLSAYLMPKAKIRVFIWFFTLARNFYISAWILAIWYIGWDTWDLLTSTSNGGINLIAHVSGGITGYLIGYYWLKETREDTQDELADEIEYQRSKRADRHTTQNLSFSGNRQYLADKQQQRQFKKDEDEYMSRLYQCVRVHNDSEAIILMLEEYEFYRPHPEIYEEKFQQISAWGNSRTLLCLGRICINLLLESKQYKRIIPVLQRCQSITDEFILANPDEVLLLAYPLIDLQQYEAAYCLIHNAEKHYGKYINATQCQLLEVKLLWQHLERHDEAHKIINNLLINPPEAYKNQILELAKNMQRII